MILYHGTLESLVPEILRTGLQPRGERPSHDAYMDSASMPPFLYLTSSFGIAVQHAVRISERVHQGTPISVFEIDTKVLKLALRYPDEDYLREEWNSDFTDWTLKEQLAYMEHHQDEWRESLKMMKVIAYKGVIKPPLLRLAPVPRWMEDGYRKRLPRKVNRRPYEENHQAYGEGRRLINQIEDACRNMPGYVQCGHALLPNVLELATANDLLGAVLKGTPRK